MSSATATTESVSVSTTDYNKVKEMRFGEEANEVGRVKEKPPMPADLLRLVDSQLGPLGV